MADRISEIRDEYHKGYNAKERLRGWIAYLLEELDKERGKSGLMSQIINRAPFCPDHRDKVHGQPCFKCELDKRDQRIVELKDEVERWKLRATGIHI